MTGFDFEAVAAVIEQRTGIPTFGFPTTGMNTYIHGVSMAFAGLARRFVDTACAERVPMQDDTGIKVNILGLTPLDFSTNGQDASIVKWLESEGFEVVSKWAMGSSLEEISRSAEADVNLVVSAAGYGAARVLYERFGMPYAIGFPVGNDLPGLLADQIRLKVKEYYEAGGAGAAAAEGLEEISVDSGVFLDGSTGKGGSTYESGFVAVIGEGITSLSLASTIELEYGIPAKVLCATECPDGILRSCDRMTPDEDDIIPELEGAAYVIADPMYKPIVPESVKFISLPHEAFSGRLYRDEIPDLIADFRSFSEKGTFFLIDNSYMQRFN
jgi:hypothetical protein